MAASASPPSPALLSRVSRPNSASHGAAASRLFLCAGPTRPSPAFLRAPPSRRSSAAAFSSRTRKSSQAARTTGPSGRKRAVHDEDMEEDDVDEDAFEALFNQLEEDLKNDKLSDDDFDDEISEEDMVKLEEELAEALGDCEFVESFGKSSSTSVDSDVDDENDETTLPKLKNWQLRRLARALKIGRRKTSIKNLAAELGLERAFVLQLLRNPPPNLLLMSVSLPDEVTQPPQQSEGKAMVAPAADRVNPTENEPRVKFPVHVMQTKWSAQKRLKKVQVETLERVYFRTKRPTNAMVSSIVHVTNLPWKVVVKWFEDRRLQDGVPEHRVPYRRVAFETMSTS